VIVSAATNRPDILDPALLRPGRFDRRVTIDNPDIRGRTAILDVHSKGKPMERDIDMQDIARQTPGFSGADLANLINEAALLSARRNRKTIGLHELTEAIDRVSMGPARKSKVMSEEERSLVAYHEAGHAMVAFFMPEGKAIGKMSIISRGHAGGFTRYEQEDKSLQTRPELEAMIASAMGGRIAEVLKFGKITTGASSDIEQATKIARGMVTQFGMSDKLGMRMLGKREGGAIFLGREMSEQRDYSLRTEIVIDSEIDRLLQEGEDSARRILTENEKQLDALARYLLEHETIESSEFKELMSGKDPALVQAPRFTQGTTSAESPPDDGIADEEEDEAPETEMEPEPTPG
jgi:cell division protease FtsH